MKYYIKEINDRDYADMDVISSEKPIYYYGLFTEWETSEAIPDSWGWYAWEILHKTTLLAVRTYNGLMGKCSNRPCLKNEITKKFFEKMQISMYQPNQPIEAENDDEAIEKFFNMKLKTR